MGTIIIPIFYMETLKYRKVYKWPKTTQLQNGRAGT